MVGFAILLLLAASFAPRYLLLTFSAFAVSGLLLLFSLLKFMLVDRAFFVVLALFFYLMASGFLVGALSISDLLNVDFYDGDGRIFICYFPLLFFCAVNVGQVHLRIIVKTAYWMAVSVLFACLVWLLRIDGGYFGDYRFLYFQTHHTGAGTYFGMLAILLVVVGDVLRRKSYVIVGVSLLLPIVLTTSRQALIGTLFSLCLLVLRRYRLFIPIAIIAATFVLVSLPSVSPKAFERLEQLVSVDTFKNAQRQIEMVDWRPEYGIGESLVGEQWNILARLLFFIRAIKLFEDSPVFGVGFARYNDYFLQFSGVRGAFYFATTGEKVFNTKSAHNSYLHMLAETGLFGLSLLVILWLYLVRRVFKARKFFNSPGFKLELAVSTAAPYILIPVIVGAFFGHAFATPSFGFFVITIFGAILRYSFARSHDGD